MHYEQPSQERNDRDNVSPALLSKTEFRWLSGGVTVSKHFEYQIRWRIRKKLQTLIDLELPLLIQAHFINYEDNTGFKRDWETGSSKTMAQALVRQRSRVQIPAKAYPFLEKEKEMNSYDFPESLLKTVSSLPNIVSSPRQSRRRHQLSTIYGEVCHQSTSHKFYHVESGFRKIEFIGI